MYAASCARDRSSRWAGRDPARRRRQDPHEEHVPHALRGELPETRVPFARREDEDRRRLSPAPPRLVRGRRRAAARGADDAREGLDGSPVRTWAVNAELRTEIASYNTRAVVSVVPLLANSPLRFTRAMTVDMSPTIYFARDLVVQEGNSGDEMFFISNGMAEILLRACGNVAIHVISDGCYFGEVAVLFDGKRTASIRTLSVTVMYSLSAKSLLAAIADFPEIEAYLQRIAKLRRDFLLELGKAFAEDTPLPEKDDPRTSSRASTASRSRRRPRLTHANFGVPGVRPRVEDAVAPEADAARRAGPGRAEANLANSPSKGHLAMLKNQPTKAELAILGEDRPSVSFSPAEVLEAASQERAKKLHDKQVRLLGKAERTRATVVQMKGSAGDQRHNVRKFARATGQF
ncbi:voltage-gated potassium channel [Aureococcus anophagefferens]|nr:voltage-gated potassium channel [Aureococcus anophagefferens]